MPIFEDTPSASRGIAAQVMNMIRLGLPALVLGMIVAFSPLPHASAQPPGKETIRPSVQPMPIFPGESPDPGQEESRPESRFADAIETDRDSFTPATTTAGRRRLIVESAYSFLDNRGVKETHSFPELIFRYGLTDRLELRLGWNYEVGGAGNEISGVDVGDDDLPLVSGLERESRLSYGLKFQVTEPREWLPRSAVILQGFSPTSGKATDTLFAGAYVFGWELPRRWQFDSAIRYATGSEEEDRFDSWAPSAVIKVPAGERLNVHAEYFGIFSSGKAEEFTRHFFSPGAHYLITPDVEVGVRVGWGLNDQSTRFFTNVGFGWRF
jgi:hypothetical protein